MKKLALAGLAAVACLVALPVLADAALDAASPEYRSWYHGFCSLSEAQQAILFQAVAYILGPIGGAAILANLRGILPGWTVPLVDFVGANWAPMLRRLMDGGTKPAAAILLCAVLASCATGDKVATIAASPTGAALVAGVNNFSPGVSNIVDKINAGLAATEDDKRMVCGAVSWVSVAFNAFAPAFGLDPGMLADAQAGEVAANALCNGPTSDIASAVATVSGAYLRTAAKLQAGGVPVATVIAAAPGS